MIGKLTGTILEKNQPELLLEVGGIGYEILCPMSSFYAMSNEVNISLYTHLSVKEDSHTLYGFITKDEKTIFRELIRVNGVGPKVALAILSHLDISSLMSAVANDDDALLAKTPGIGKKTAQKLIVELKDRLAKLNLIKASNQATTINNKNPNSNQALAALQSLGFKVKEAEKMIASVSGDSLSTEELIRHALQNK
ncbi:MAG: Holliday junction branch migration protein RuvA [Gammaproteobacteria bacterium]|nr:MAG: Holliday junction branch migration protein RuvA [Gammaproteobacteria bacterium]